jgi:hypothetical protein
MAINNFIPTIWSANLIASLKKVHVFGALANREYEGEISGAGDTVKISQIGAISVADYVKNSTEITPQELSDASTMLLINQSKYFAFKIDDIDAAQSKPKVMQQAMAEASYSLADAQDAYMASLYTQCGMSVGADSPINMTSLNVEDSFLLAAETMDNNSVPRTGRFACIAPWVLTKLILAGIASLSENNELWTNGYVGRALGFDFSISPNISKNSSSWDATRNILGVKNMTFGLAEQIVKTEAYRPEKSFSDAVKGLHVYGAKIVRPDTALVLYADKTAEA